MKKLNLFSLIGLLALFAFAVTVSSCSSDDEDGPISEVVDDSDYYGGGSGSGSSGSSSSSGSSDDDRWVMKTRTGFLYYYCPSEDKKKDSHSVSVSVYYNKATDEYRIKWAGDYYEASPGQNYINLGQEVSHKVGNSRVKCEDYMVLQVNVF